MFLRMLTYFQYLYDYIKSVLAPWVIGLLSIYNNLSLFFAEYLYFLNIRVIFGSRRFSLFLLRCVQAHVLKHWLTLECCVCKFHSVDQIKLQCKLIKTVILWNKRKKLKVPKQYFSCRRRKLQSTIVIVSIVKVLQKTRQNMFWYIITQV